MRTRKRSKEHMELNILWKYQLVDPQGKAVFCWYGLFKYKHFLFVNFAWVVASNKIYFSLCHFLCHIVTSSGQIKSRVTRKEQNCGNLLQTGTDWWVDRLSLWRSRKFLTYLYEIVDKRRDYFYIFIFWFASITDEPETLYLKIMLSI